MGRIGKVAAPVMIAPAVKGGDAASTAGLTVVHVDAASAVEAKFDASDVSDVLTLAVVGMVAESAVAGAGALALEVVGVAEAVAVAAAVEVAASSAMTTAHLCKIGTGLGQPAAEGTGYTAVDADINVFLCVKSQEVCPLPDGPEVCCPPMASHRAACQRVGPAKKGGKSGQWPGPFRSGEQVVVRFAPAASFASWSPFALSWPQLVVLRKRNSPSSCGLVRWQRLTPSSRAIAKLADAGSQQSTKAYPRGLPEAGSITSSTSERGAACKKSSNSRSSVTSGCSPEIWSVDDVRVKRRFLCSVVEMVGGVEKRGI